MVLMLLVLQINDAEFDTYHSHDAPAVEQEVALTASHTAACHGAVYCNFVIDHAEAAGALNIAPKGTSDFPPESTFPAGRADEFDTPPPRQGFFVT
jgi:hypothetical protein